MLFKITDSIRRQAAAYMSKVHSTTVTCDELGNIYKANAMMAPYQGAIKIAVGYIGDCGELVDSMEDRDVVLCQIH